jgi:hypothetical protein
LASGTITNSQVSDSIPNWVSCTLSSPYALTESTKYAIVIHGDSLSASITMVWSYDNDGASSDYPGGDLEWSTNGGSSWSTTTTHDLLFRCRDASSSPELTVLVGDRITSGSGVASVWAYNNNGELQWTYDTGNNTLDVVIDSNNDVYVSGQAGNDGSGTKNLWKFDSVGNKLGGRYVRSTTYAWDLALDSTGRIIVGTGLGAARVQTNLATEEVITSSGTIGGVAVDTNDDSIYIGSGGTPVNLRKYSSSLGAPLWQKDPSTGATVTDIAIMSNQRVLISLNYSAGKKVLYSWDKDGNNQLDYDGGITTNADSVAVDSNNNVFLVTNDTATKTFVYLNSSLVEQDYLDHGAILRRAMVSDDDDKPYVVGIRKGSVLCWKYDSSVLEDAIQCPTDEIEGIAFSSGASITPLTTKNDYFTDGAGAINFQGTNWRAQTFTANGNYSLIGIKLGFYRQGSPGDTTLSIRATDGTGKPTGADLATATFDSNLTTQTSGEWRYYELSSPLSLTDGTKYAIVMGTPSGDIFNRLLCLADLIMPMGYPDGDCYDSTDSGSSWTIDNVRELLFETIRLIIIPPNITDESASSESIAGAQVDLYVTATGDPAPTYQWYKNNVIIPGATNSTLTVYPFVTTTYKCKATNDGGVDWSNDMVITVKPNPHRYNPYNLPLDSERIT